MIRDLCQTPSLTMLDGVTPAPRLVPERTVFLQIDMQHYAADRHRGLGRKALKAGRAKEFEYYFDSIEDMLPRIASVSDSLRTAGCQIAHVISEGRTRDGRDLSREYRRRNVTSVKGAPDSPILPVLAPTDDDLLFRKTTAGGFAGTDLDFTLRSMGISTVVVAGVATNQCVESTVREASHLGYDVVLLQDCCATYNPQWQQFSLESMGDQFAYLCTASELEVLFSAGGLDPRGAGHGSGRLRM